MTKKQFVQSERKFTIDLLKSLSTKQWQMSTLCEGWSVEDLAAHLVSRERNAVASLGLVIPRLELLHTRKIVKIKARGHTYILQKLARYPWYMPASLNVAEFWVHNEDFLRGELKMSRKPPTKTEQELLWGNLVGLARLRKSLVSDLGSVQLENTQTTQIITIENHTNAKDTVVKGTAGELLLYFYGRRGAAKVEVSSVTI